MATKLNRSLEGWLQSEISKSWKQASNAFNNNQLEVKQLYSSVKRNDFSRYPVKFNTSKVKKQITRSYGSFKAGKIGLINGFADKAESWRMLNVLLHDRQLHQRYSRTLVRATHELTGTNDNLKREVRRIFK